LNLAPEHPRGTSLARVDAQELELERRLPPGVDVQNQVVARTQPIFRGEDGELARVVGGLPGERRDPDRARGGAQRSAVLQRIVGARRRARRARRNRDGGARRRCGRLVARHRHLVMATRDQ
jgi:hypothetical protein